MCKNKTLDKNLSLVGRHLLLSPNHTLPGRKRIMARLKVSKSGAPLDLGYIGTQLGQRGSKVKLVFANRYNLSLSDVEREIRQFEPDTVGITSSRGYVCVAGSIEPTFQVLDLIRRKFSHIRVLVFGGIAYYFTELLLSRGADVVIRKEPELKYLEVINNFPEFGTVTGISYRKGGCIVHNPDDTEQVDLNLLPPINYHLLNPDHLRIEMNPMYYDYTIPSKKFVTLETSRGCPYDCIFCNLYHHGRKMRYKSTDKVLDEIQYYKSEFGVDVFCIPDPTFTINRQRVIDLCERIRQLPYKIYWRAVTRPDYVDLDLLGLMKSAGCYHLSFGFETADDEILKGIRKKFTAEDVEQAVKMCKKIGITASLFSLFFLPGETRQSIDHTLKFTIGVKPLWVGANIATPIPYTELYKMGQAEGKLKGERLLEECIEYAGTIGTDFEPEEVKKIYKRIRKRLILTNLTSNPFCTVLYLFSIAKNLGNFLDFTRHYLDS